MSESDPQPRQIRKRIGRNVFDAPPRISVIITVHNQSAHIRETVESAVTQRYREHEVIVINDGSDDTNKLERELKMRFEDITYIRQRHAGKGVALNTGIEHARGQLIAFLNAGDVWQADFLASQFVFLERHGLDLVYCDASIFGTSSVYRRTFSEKYPSEGEVDASSLLSRKCNVLISGTLARKSAIVQAGQFEFGTVAKPGFHLWLRMAKAGARMGYQTKQLVKLRIQRDHLPEDSLERVELERDLFARISSSIYLTDTESQIVDRRIAELESQLAVEQGNSFLKSGDYTEAITAFRVANQYQPSLKLKAITWLTRVAPRTALRLTETNHQPDNRYGHL